MLDTKGYKQTLRMCNAYSFSTEKTLHERAKCYYSICTVPAFPYFQEPYDLPWMILFLCNQIILVSHIFFVSPLQILNLLTYFYETWCKCYITGSHHTVTSYSI